MISQFRLCAEPYIRARVPIFLPSCNHHAIKAVIDSARLPRVFPAMSVADGLSTCGLGCVHSVCLNGQYRKSHVE